MSEHGPLAPIAEDRALHIRAAEIRLLGRTLLRDLTVSVSPGDIVSVMGPSGCGKSTLLSWICGTLDGPFETSGSVLIGSRDLLKERPEHRRVGILYQDDLLFPHLSVAQNLSFGLPAEVRGRAARREAVAGALADAEMAGFEARDPATLSGGQRARVALMRTLLSQPHAVLLDEPFSKLDADLRGRMREFVFGHIRRRALPTLLVTHDPEDAAAAGGPVISMS